MFGLEPGHVVDIIVNNYPQVIGFLVRRNGIFGEGLGHDGP